MTNQEAIEVLRANWPDKCYSELCEALSKAIEALGDIEESSKHCTYYEHNDKKPCCTHDCYGCIWCE